MAQGGQGQAQGQGPGGGQGQGPDGRRARFARGFEGRRVREIARLAGIESEGTSLNQEDAGFSRTRERIRGVEGLAPRNPQPRALAKSARCANSALADPPIVPLRTPGPRSEVAGVSKS